MKKSLLISLVVIGVLVLLGGGGVFLLKKGKKVSPSVGAPTPQEKVVEVSLEDRPYVKLIPSSDGHWLTIDVSRIKNAEMLEYELLYNTASGTPQGSVNTVDLEGETSYSKKILLGSESSGHYKYDEGVKEGVLTIRLRGGGETMRFESDFRLQEGTDSKLISGDDKFKLEGEFSPGEYYVTLSTIGLPAEVEDEVLEGPYGIFSSGISGINSGKVEWEISQEKGEIYFWDNKNWRIIDNSVDKIGVFITVMAE